MAAPTYEVEVIRRVRELANLIDQAHAADGRDDPDYDDNFVSNLAILESAVAAFLADPYAGA